MIIIDYKELAEEYTRVEFNIVFLAGQYGLNYSEIIRQLKNKQLSNLIYINSGFWNELADDYNTVQNHIKEYAKTYGIGINKLKDRLADTDIDKVGTSLSAISQTVKNDKETA